MAKRTKGGRYNESTMYPMIKLYEDSGMTQKQFCKEHHIAPHAFSYWLTKYRKAKATGPKEASRPKFKELAVNNVAEQIESSRLMRITYPDGTLVELPV